MLPEACGVGPHTDVRRVRVRCRQDSCAGAWRTVWPALSSAGSTGTGRCRLQVRSELSSTCMPACWTPLHPMAAAVLKLTAAMSAHCDPYGSIVASVAFASHSPYDAAIKKLLPAQIWLENKSSCLKYCMTLCWCCCDSALGRCCVCLCSPAGRCCRTCQHMGLASRRSPSHWTMQWPPCMTSSARRCSRDTRCAHTCAFGQQQMVCHTDCEALLYYALTPKIQLLLAMLNH
jgi:hypothetical protein